MFRVQCSISKADLVWTNKEILLLVKRRDVHFCHKSTCFWYVRISSEDLLKSLHRIVYLYWRKYV